MGSNMTNAGRVKAPAAAAGNISPRKYDGEGPVVSSRDAFFFRMAGARLASAAALLGAATGAVLARWQGERYQ
jgi:hypothetical protein